MERVQTPIFLDTRLNTFSKMLEGSDGGGVVYCRAALVRGHNAWQLDVVVCVQPRTVLRAVLISSNWTNMKIAEIPSTKAA